jgi:hypothetical protein
MPRTALCAMNGVPGEDDASTSPGLRQGYGAGCSPLLTAESATCLVRAGYSQPGVCYSR